MFTRVLVIFTAFSVLAAATTTVTVHPTPTPTPIPASQCNTGGLTCCNSTQMSSNSVIIALLNSLGIALAGVDALVGVTCSPINVLGIGSGGACTAQPVCCENNNFNGVVAIGCVPVTVGI